MQQQILTVWFGPDGKEIGRGYWRFPAPDEDILAKDRASKGIPADALQWQTTDQEVGNLPRLMLVDGVASLDPAWQPPAPPPDPLAALAEEVRLGAQAVARNIAASPHDKRGLTDKDIGKLIIPKIKANPGMTVDEALDEIVEMILAELPGEPIIPALWVERPRKSNPAETVYMGLGPSYLHEAIKRGYCPPDTPMTWASLVGLIAATPEKQIAAWLRSL
ncbi:MAG: hypothetical protein HY794_18185 [Desulfarculus sp.]|nr:hypothetical protein [Desulfarculus sp.]